MLMGQPFTNDYMEPIPLHGRTYPVKGGKVVIPTVNGDAIVVLDDSGKRKDWMYVITYRDQRFIHVSWSDLLSGLALIIPEGDVLHA